MRTLLALGKAYFLSLPLTSALSHPHGRRDGIDSARSSWVYKADKGNVTFAVTAVKDVGDLYFHLEAPADYSWVAVGTGEQMEGSLMWVVYKNGSGNGVTLSTRTVDGHVEPSYNDKVDCQVNNDHRNTNSIVKLNSRDTYIVNGHCKNVTHRSFARKRDGGGDKAAAKLDFASTAQKFIFALGPTSKRLHSDSKTADIRRHSVYGQFSMDLSNASVDTSDHVDYDDLAKMGNWINMNAQPAHDVSNDFDWSGPVHAAAMCGTFVVLFPIGVVFLRVLEKVRWHAWMQAVGAVLSIIGVGIGIYLGREYNHSKDVNSAHQIFGLVIVVFTIGQFSLGYYHHLLYKRHKLPTMFGRIHLYLGPLILITGAVNGFLGFDFAGEENDNIWYGIIVGIIFVALFITLFLVRRRKKKAAVGRLGGPSVADEAYEGFQHRGELSNGFPLRDVSTEGLSGVEHEQPRAFV